MTPLPTCEYRNLPDIQRLRVPNAMLRRLGVDQRVLAFERESPRDPWHALQLNYGEVVLWRRWTCRGRCRLHRREADVP